MRDLYLRLDDLPEETLSYEDSVEIPLAPGEHRISVTNRLGKQSMDFDISEGETIKFRVANLTSKGPVAWLMMITGTIPYRSTIERLG